MIDLISAAHSAASLKHFIEQDIASHLITLQFNAAAATLEGLQHAKDKKFVCWSVINHIEDVEQGLISKLKSPNHFQAAKQYIYASALKASLYKYLNEVSLVQKCCDDTLFVVNTHNRNVENSVLPDSYLLWNPAYWFYMYRYNHSNIGKIADSFDAQKFWRIVANREENFGLLVIHDLPDDVYREYR